MYAQVQPVDAVTLSFGGGLDDLRNEDLTYLVDAQDARSRNAFLFGNLLYEVRAGLKIGFELSGWTTDYTNVTAGNDPTPTDIRLQWSVQSHF